MDLAEPIGLMGIRGYRAPSIPQRLLGRWLRKGADGEAANRPVWVSLAPVMAFPNPPIHPISRRLNLHKCFRRIKSGCIATEDRRFYLRLAVGLYTTRWLRGGYAERLAAKEKVC